MTWKPGNPDIVWFISKKYKFPTPIGEYYWKDLGIGDEYTDYFDDYDKAKEILDFFIREGYYVEVLPGLKDENI
jgi:hypothetical protein